MKLKKIIAIVLMIVLFCGEMPQIQTVVNAETNIYGKVKEVVLGYNHSATITELGNLYCWGDNYYGQIGNGTTEGQLTPVKVLSNVKSVSLGNSHSAAITELGDLYCWGDNSSGQIGNGTTEDQLTPVKVLSDVQSVAVASNSSSAAITKSGDLYCWGFNGSGQIGNGTTEDQLTPVKVLSNVKSVSLGSSQSAAITESGDLYCWGVNTWGEVGNGTTEDQLTPVKVLDNIKSVVLKESKCAAITESGELYCWGNNADGQVGNGIRELLQSTPVKVLDNVESVTFGSFHSAAITKSGELYCWGYWYDDKYYYQLMPVKVLDNVKSVSLGFWYSAAITKSGELYCWGDAGVAGIGIQDAILTPEKILDNVGSVSIERTDGAGMSNSCVAITKSGELYCWGNNYYGQLGNGTTTRQLTPIKISLNNENEDDGGSNPTGPGTSSGTSSDFKNDDSDNNIKIGQKVKFTVSDSVPIIGGGDISLDFDNIPIQFVKDGNTFKLGIGTKDLSKVSETQWFNFKKFVEKQNDDIKKGIKSLLSTKTGKANMGLGKNNPSNIEIGCYGYLEGTITSKGVESAGGEMVIEIKAKAKKEWQTVVVVVPVVIKASGEVGVKAEVQIGLDFTKSKVYTKGTLTLTLPKIKLSAGVGVAYIADISVYGSATNELEITASNSTKTDVAATLKGELGVSAKVLFAEYEKKLLSGEWQYYSSSGSSKKKTAGIKSRGISTFGIDKDDEYTIEREKQSNWTNSDNSTTIENTVVLNDVYHSAQPQIVQTGSGKKVLVYTADIDTRSTGNHTAVVYSIYNENTKKWSELTIIDDDGTADFNPSVAVNGENVYVAWSNSNKVFTARDVSDKNFITKVASSLDIELATINLSNNSVTKKKLNTNDKLDMNASVTVHNGNAYVGWIENENNDIYEMTGNNSIYVSDISKGTTKLYTSESTQIISMAVGNLEDEVCIAYAVDEDSDLSTTDDIHLCVGELSGNTGVVETGCYNNIQFAKVSGTDSILCYSNNEDGTASIACSDKWWELSDSLNNDIVITSDYRYLEGKDSDLLICSSDKEGDKEEGTDIFAYVIKDGNVSEVVNITDNEGYTRNVSGIYSDGNYLLAYTRTDVNMGGEKVDESTDLCISQITPSKNLKMEGVSYNPEEIQPDEKLDVTVNVKNNGLQPDSNYVVQVLSGTEVIGETIGKDILNVGEEAEVTVSVNILEDFEPETKLTFRVVASDGKLISEGSITEKVGKADLQLEVNKANNTVNVSVKNTTAFDCGATLYIKDTDADGKVYKTYNIGKIKGNGSYELSIDKKKLDSLEKGNVNLFFEVVADQEELYYSNNTGYIYIECSHTSTKSTLTKATSSKDGKKVVACKGCGKTISSTTIPKIGGISLSKATYTYDGKVKKPSVSVKDSLGKTISSSNYSVSYSDNTNVGKATVKVIFKGNYSGSLIKTYTINPKGTAIKGKLTAKKKKIIVKWNKVSKQISGYQVQYSTNKKFTKKTTKSKTAKASKKKLTIKKLKAEKKYYVRIRTYKLVGGAKYYSVWSKSKSGKTK